MRARGRRNGGFKPVRYNLESGEKLTGDLPLHNERAFWCGYSPDGRYLATWAYDGLAIVSDAQSGKEIRRLEHLSRVSAAAFSPDGRYLVTGTYAQSSEVWVWDLVTGETVAKAQIPALEVIPFLEGSKSVFPREIAFSPDGRHFALACAGSPLCVWKIEVVPLSTVGRSSTTLISPNEILTSPAGNGLSQ